MQVPLMGMTAAKPGNGLKMTIEFCCRSLMGWLSLLSVEV